MSNENFAISLQLTPEQARAVVRAIDVYMRIHLGQFNIIREQFGHRPDADTHRGDAFLFEARRALIPELDGGPGHSFSIRSCPDQAAKVAFDVLQELRQKEAYGRNPDGGITVVYDNPFWVSDSTPRPKAKILDVLDQLADI